MSGERRLVSLRRAVPPAEGAAYDALWGDLRREATALGAHAWRFRSAARADLFLEFLEFRAAADPRAEPGPAAALERLERVHPAETEEWIDTPSP